jgi:cytochrome P450
VFFSIWGNFGSTIWENASTRERVFSSFSRITEWNRTSIGFGPFKHLPPNKKWKEACAVTHRFADHYVNQGLEYRDKLLATKSNMSESSKSNILLYNMVEETQDRVFLMNQVLQGLIASQDTTSSMLGNVFFLLARHPLVWKKLHREVLSVGHTRDYNTLMGMDYLQKVLKEGKNFTTSL